MIALDATLVSHAEPKKFEVLLVDDVSRLSRDQIEIERLRRKFMCWGIRLIGISDGIDATSKGHRLQTGVQGLSMSSISKISKNKLIEA